jgi:hypothetical protein
MSASSAPTLYAAADEPPKEIFGRGFWAGSTSSTKSSKE